MLNASKTCPHCGSLSAAYRLKARLWECQDCEERFAGDEPTLNLRPSIDDQAVDPKHIFFSYDHDQHQEFVELIKANLERRWHTV